LTFEDARLKLMAHVLDQVRNGEVTERGLARRIGISQPHVHNVLKGVRTLSPEIGDLLLRSLHLSLLDLAPLEEIEAQIARRRARQRVTEVPFLATPIGPSRSWPAGVNWRKSFPLPFRSTTVPEQLVMAKIVADPAMTGTLASYDIALLDTSEQGRATIDPHRLYVIERNEQAAIRYIRPGARGAYLATDANLDHPAAWEPLPLSSMQLSEAVKARLLWLGREADRDASTQCGRFLDNPTSS